MTKQPIVILHGWGSSPDRWQTVRDCLAALMKESGNNIFVPPLPGFNGKELPRAYGIDDYVAWLDRYLDKKNIKNPVLIGHSNGGRIAMRYAALQKTGDNIAPKNPRKNRNIAGLILIGAAGIPETNLSTKKTIFKALAASGKKILSPLKNTPAHGLYNLAEKALYKFARESDYLKASPIMKQTMQKLLAYDARPDLKKISCPTLCIWGREDQSTPLWMAQRIATDVPGCTIMIIEGGHNIHITHPQEVSARIAAFI